MKKILMRLFLLTAVSISIIIPGCFIAEILQPSSVEAGGIFTATITVTDVNAEHQNPHKGVLAILVPEDWSFIDGTYDTPMGKGNMVLDTSAHPLWGDVDTVIQRPAGMKWIFLLSDQGYLHDANLVYEGTVNLRVGQTTGDYAIGYLVTVNTTDILEFLNDQDQDQELAGSDTSMNHIVTVTPATGVDETKLNNSPEGFSLSQNYPNPFNPSTSINYSVPNSSNVRLSVFDLCGKEVAVLVDGYIKAGNHSVSFSAENLSSGVYYYKIAADGFSQTRKMILIK